LEKLRPTGDASLAEYRKTIGGAVDVIAWIEGEQGVPSGEKALDFSVRFDVICIQTPELKPALLEQPPGSFFQHILPQPIAKAKGGDQPDSDGVQLWKARP